MDFTKIASDAAADYDNAKIAAGLGTEESKTLEADALTQIAQPIRSIEARHNQGVRGEHRAKFTFPPDGAATGISIELVGGGESYITYIACDVESVTPFRALVTAKLKRAESTKKPKVISFRYNDDTDDNVRKFFSTIGSWIAMYERDGILRLKDD